MYTYYMDDVRTKRIWQPVKSDACMMFQSYPLFEFPPEEGKEEPLRYGPFIIDIDTGIPESLDAAQRIVSWFEGTFDVPTGAWKYYFSGGKGVHLELPESVFGIYGHKLLPSLYKRLALEIQGECSVVLDISLYCNGTGRPFRQPNIQRENGLYKVQIEYDDLFEVETLEEYNQFCCEPKDLFDPEPYFSQSLHDSMAGMLKEIESLPKPIPITEEQQKRLSEKTPPCVNFMRSRKEQAGTSNFNEIAIQLTAFGISSGMCEDRFVSGIQDFIENYPSTSLKTQKARYDNVRNRFRSMSAANYSFSCAAIKSLKMGSFSDFDCKQCHFLACSEDENICTADDLQKESRHLEIPEFVYKGVDMIERGLDAAVKATGNDIIQYNLPVVMGHIINSVAGKISYKGVHPNLFMLKIGETSTGKSDIDKAFRRAYSSFFDTIRQDNNGKDKFFNTFYGANDFSSGPAFLRSLQRLPQALILMDEVKFLFERKGKADAVTEAKIAAILEINTAAGTRYTKPYANMDSEIIIENPVPTLVGNATSDIFNALSVDDLSSGLIQRFEFFCYDGQAKYRQRTTQEERSKALDLFVQDLDGLTRMDIFKDYYMVRNVPYDMKNPQTPDVGITDEACIILENHSNSVIDKANAETDNGKKGIISRSYHNSIKYALLHSVCTRQGRAIFDPLDVADIEYGIKFANFMTEWKLNVLVKNLSAGDWAQKVDTMFQAIVAANKMSQKPTGKVLKNRRRKLEDLKPHEWDAAVKTLKAQGKIILKEEKIKGKDTTCYYVKKGYDND